MSKIHLNLKWNIIVQSVGKIMMKTNGVLMLRCVLIVVMNVTEVVNIERNG